MPYRYSKDERMSTNSMRAAFKEQILDAALSGITRWIQEDYPNEGIEIKVIQSAKEISLRCPTPAGPEYFEVLVKWRV